jgi:hypothetical protein
LQTLEHWASQYVTYRYRSKASLWWPTRGEDIDVRSLPVKPGKAVQIELKTTTVSGADFHDVLVDLGQLWEYRQRPLGRQPFYAFPVPDWRGELAVVASKCGVPVTDLAFSRSGRGWWFADWMVVLTSAQVADVLCGELKSHCSSVRGTKARLVRFDLRMSALGPTGVWGAGTSPLKALGWRDFWTTLEQCGRPDWPQLIRVPSKLLGARRVLWREVAHLMTEAAVMSATDWQDEDLALLEPDGDGGYVVSPTAVDQPSQRLEVDDGLDDSRQVTFLGADALYPKRRRG